MSFDRQIDQVCPHAVVEEVLDLGFDGRTVRPRRAIASADSVTLRVGRQMEVPPEGLFSPAETYGLSEGPFHVRAGINDALYARVGPDEHIQTIQIPEGIFAADRLADTLTQQVRGTTWEVTSKGSLWYRTNALGPAISTMFLDGSTLPSLLGMPTGRIWRGRTIVPGWSLVVDPLTLSDRPTRLIVFDDALKSFSPILEVDYTTIRQECRRCGGLGVENDWRYGADGSTVEVRDEALLIQEILKMVYTVRGSNPFHLWYGTSITNRVGTKLLPDGLTLNMIQSDLATAFRQWQQIKKYQEEAAGQAVSDEEFPYQLLGVDVQQSRKDPTIVFVSMTIQNRALGRPLVLERGIKIPQPTDLLGSTANQGILRQSLSKFTLTG